LQRRPHGGPAIQQECSVLTKEVPRGGARDSSAAGIPAADFDPGRIARWQPAHYDIAGSALLLITAADAQPILPGLDLWDCWPLERTDGSTVCRDGCEFWFFLSAPRFDDPGRRHDEAQIRLVLRDRNGWHDAGPALPDGVNPGSREWAGSAVLWDDTGALSLFFTAAGRRGAPHSFEQRLFEITGRLAGRAIVEWGSPAEIVASDGVRYVAACELTGVPGAIKAFRDPAFFRDPATGCDHMLFAASAGWDADPHNGVIGMTTRRGGAWRLDDPLVEAIGINNELERPHVRIFAGRYYLFFSTQTRTFAPTAARGPNGLYAFSADAMAGPWRAVNGSGLVAANPAAEPTQAYSWWVGSDGSVIAFIDHWGMAGRDIASDPALLRGQFGGTPAPVFHIDAAGNSITIRR
jgi:levansucrase